MNLRDRIDNNLTIYTLTIAVASFGTGVAADRWAKEIFGPPSPSTECKTEVWQELARKAEWTPLSQCPAFPLKIQITSPGTGSTFQIDSYQPKRLNVPFVVSTSRPLPEVGDLGFVVKAKNTSNYFVVFPLMSRTENTNSYRTLYGVDLPAPVMDDIGYEVRAVFVARKEILGDRFTDLGQILAADPSVVLTDSVFVTAERRVFN